VLVTQHLQKPEASMIQQGITILFLACFLILIQDYL
jgi:hypothetical protein